MDYNRNVVDTRNQQGTGIDIGVLNQNQQWLYGEQCRMQGQICEIAKTVSVLEKKKERKKLESSTVTNTKAGKIILVESYDDGSCYSDSFITSMSGVMKVTIITIAKKYKYFILRIGKETIAIGNMNKITSKGLYELVVPNVSFNLKFSETKIERALYRYFLELVATPVREVICSGYAGWEAGIFKSAEKFRCFEEIDNSLTIPALKKSFKRDEANGANIEEYSKYLSNIRSLENRTLMSLLPFAGIMHSWLKEAKYEMFPMVNLVFMTQDILPRRIAEYLQVFNRDSFQPLNLENPESYIDKVLLEAKDEVVLFIGMLSNATQYAEKKIKYNLNRMANVSRGTSYLEDGEMKALIVTLTDQMVAKRGVCNIFIDEEFFVQSCEYNKKYSKSMDAILEMFVYYVETHVKEVEGIIKDVMKSASASKQYWETVLAIVKRFWKVHGSSLREVLSLPLDFLFEFLWREEDYDIEDGADQLRSIIREAMAHIVAVKKKDASANDNFIFNEENIWISPELFHKILKRKGMEKSKNILLLQCKEKGILKVNSRETYSTRLQVEGNRKEFYCFSRDYFNTEGLSEIIDLAKEVRKSC